MVTKEVGSLGRSRLCRGLLPSVRNPGRSAVLKDFLGLFCREAYIRQLRRFRWAEWNCFESFEACFPRLFNECSRVKFFHVFVVIKF